MTNSPVSQTDNNRRSADIRFADAAAQTELANHLDVLRHPQAHEGRETERVKSNPSRTVWRCRLADGDYHLKRYHSEDLSHRLGAMLRGGDARRELRLSVYLRGHDVPAIKVLAVGRSGRRTWMVSRTLPKATAADTWHAEQLTSDDPAADAAIARTMRAVAVLIGRMHAAGVLHHDLHSGNILLRSRDGRIEPVLTDLHRAAHHRRLSRCACAKNLAQLAYDRRHVTTRTQRLRFLKQYIRVRGAGGTLRGWAILIDHFTSTHERRLYAKRDRRVTGRNAYFTSLRFSRGWRGHVVLASKRQPDFSAATRIAFTADAWRAALAEPERLLEGPEATVVKDSPTSRVIRRRLPVGSHTIDVYVKRTRRNAWYKAAADMLRGSRAIRAFRLGHALLTRRIPTAVPVAALERRTGRFLHECILITEAVPNAVMLGRLWDEGGPVDPPRPRDLAGRLGRLIRSLHDNGFAHRDLKASNLLIRRGPKGEPQAVLIDLDGLSRRLWVSQYRRFQGLMRLNAGMMDCAAVTQTDRLRVLLGYLRRPGSGRIEFRSHWHQLARRTERKLARKRKATS